MDDQYKELWTATLRGLSALRGMSRSAVIAVLLCVALAVAGIYAATTIDSDIPMPSSVRFAMIVGATVTFLLGAGLMFLMFFSSRRGYDDASDTRSDKDHGSGTAPGP
jgi:cation transporter-like permease